MKEGKKFSAITKEIAVSVQPIFLPDKTVEENNLFVWAYNVEIKNHGAEDVQLKSRYWRIIDEHGSVNEVRGEGVIGKQPIISQNEKFHYSSGTYLPTPSGIMEGEYMMEVVGTEQKLCIEIPAFSLDSPYSNHQLS